MKNNFLGRFTIGKALLTFLLLGIIIPVILFSLFFTVNLNNYLYEIERQFAQLTVQNNALQLETIIESISYTAASVISDEENVELIRNVADPDDAAQAYMAKDRLLKSLRNVSNTRLYAFNPEFTLILNSGQIINYSENLQVQYNAEMFQSEYWNDKHSEWSEASSDNNSSNIDSIWVVRDGDDILALLCIRISEDELWENLTNHPILQYNQEILYKDDVISSNLTLVDADHTLSVLEEELTSWDIKLRVSIPTSILTEQVEEQQQLFIVYFWLLIVFLIIIIQVITKIITVPVNTIIAQMKRLRQGDFSTMPPTNSFKEINMLNDVFNEVAMCISGLMKTAAEQAMLKEKLRYEALISQINPHFLYNTLNSIRWMATINGNNSVAEALSKLGGVLHYSFNNTKDITIENEIKFLAGYVELMQMRYGNPITFENDVPQDLMQMQIPRFCIQPIIENSIIHGIFNQPDGKIMLAVSVNDKGDIIIELTDNGVGMEKSRAKEIFKPEFISQNGNGVGLANVRKRLNLLYGSRYGLSVDSLPDGGCTITINLPNLK